MVNTTRFSQWEVIIYVSAGLSMGLLGKTLLPSKEKGEAGDKDMDYPSRALIKLPLDI